jgi:hypothetical protein
VAPAPAAFIVPASTSCNAVGGSPRPAEHPPARDRGPETTSRTKLMVFCEVCWNGRGDRESPFARWRWRDSKVSERTDARDRVQRVGAQPRAPERNGIMMRKIVAASCLAGITIIGAAAPAYAGGGNPSGTGPPNQPARTPRTPQASSRHQATPAPHRGRCSTNPASAASTGARAGKRTTQPARLRNTTSPASRISLGISAHRQRRRRWHPQPPAPQPPAPARRRVYTHHTGTTDNRPIGA